MLGGRQLVPDWWRWHFNFLSLPGGAVNVKRESPSCQHRKEVVPLVAKSRRIPILSPMLKRAFNLLLHDRPAFYGNARVHLLRKWCGVFGRTGFYCQGRMDIDPRSWWFNPKFVGDTGGFFVAGDPAKRAINTLEPWDSVRRDMIIMLLRDLVERKVEGDLAELGVFRGSTARLIHHYLPERKFYLFDTFAGFAERDVQIEAAQTGRSTKSSEFALTTLDLARRNVAQQNENVQFFPGYFPESAPAFLKDRTFAFVNLDADLYEPTFAGLNFFYERMVPGGYILVHDYSSWPGARKAVQEFFKDKPETPVPMPDKSGSALISKMRLRTV